MMNAAALVVGINNYAHVPQLSGSVENAEKVVKWLQAIGVPAARIRLHADPAPPGLDPAIAVGLPTRQAIKDSLFSIATESGDRLFVFLTGHGLYIPGEGAVFLTQEWKDPNNLDANFGILALVDYLLSLHFRDQLLVCDACQNPSNPATQRARIPPEGVGITGFTPDYANNGLALCQATTEGQFAYLVDGRSLLTPKLIRVLADAAGGSPPRGAEDAIVHDWATGERKLDLKPLFAVVRRDVEATAQSRGPQRPVLTPFGRARSEDQLIVHELSSRMPQIVEINVVNGGLDEVRLALRPPVKEISLPISSASPPFPYAVKAPLGARLQAACWTQAGWTPDPRAFDGEVPNGGLTIKFTLSQSLPSVWQAGGNASLTVPTPPQDLTQFNVRIIASDGQIRGALDSHDYSTMLRLPGMSASPGLAFHQHEAGPDISFPPGGEAKAERLARDWRDAINDLLAQREPGLEATMVPPGVSVEEGRPNLRIALTPGHAEALAGHLAGDAAIQLERIGDATGRDKKSLKLQRLKERSLIRLTPGMWRASLDLPWGQWLETFETEAAGLTELSLPTEIGRPPLRNARPDRIVYNGHQLGFVSEEASRAEFVREDFGSIGNRIEIWKVGTRQFSVPVGGSTPYPWGSPDLRARIEAEALRVEPYSDLPWPEWDLLFAASRLDAVDLSGMLRRLPDLKRFVSAVNQDGLLLLALGYAAYAHSDRSALREFLRAISYYSLRYTADYALLRKALDPQAEATGDEVGLLRHVPVFRWGLALRERFLPESESLGISNPRSTWTVLEHVPVE